LIYSFEDFELDPDRRELRRGPATVSVEPVEIKGPQEEINVFSKSLFVG